MMSNILLWCDKYAGLCSLLISAAAIVISILALKSQKKGTLLERRTRCYYEIERIYQRSLRAIEAKNAASALFALFDPCSDEYSLVSKLNERVVACMKTHSDVNSDPEYQNLFPQYADIAKHCINTSLMDDVKILYDSECTTYVKKLYASVYQEIIMNWYHWDEEKFGKWKVESIDILEEFDKHRILKKMRKELCL